MRLSPVLYAMRLVAALLLAGNICASAFAQTAVDLQLVLAVDASGSVDQRRFELQMQGYVAAFRDPRVLQAIQAGVTQAIAVTMVQWTGPALQIQVLPWTLIHDAATAHAFAAAIMATPRRLFSGGTSISGVIDYAVPLLQESPFKGTRRVIDISGDGSNNRGRPAASARDDAVRTGIIINGLPILALEPDLDRHYLDHVIGGPGAFVIAAESYESFADAIIKKLIREMAANEPWPHAGEDLVRTISASAAGAAWKTTGMAPGSTRLRPEFLSAPLQK
ncbi:MAG TPA: DUF1194 domain-containing protein [Candidatus Tectomicrobia bacterium]